MAPEKYISAGAPHALIEPRSVNTLRPFRAICIGAGISGIITAIRFPQKLAKVSLQIYEKNSDIGGTWFENRYPGCACDIPAHTYQLTFEPNKEWSQFYASAKEIHRYWKDVVRKYDCMRYIKLGKRVIEARWDASQSKWVLKIEDVATGSIFTDSCDVLFSATGVLNEWKWPNVPGLDQFKGKLLHSANWDEDYDCQNETVAVIGSGSSAIQIVPGIQKSVKHLDNYVRGRTWIATPFAANFVNARGSEANYTFTEEEIRAFKTDHKAYRKFQKGKEDPTNTPPKNLSNHGSLAGIEHELQSGHGITQRGSPEQQGAKAAFTAHMKNKTANKPSIMDQILPSFPPACRRLTPGPGYLEALSADNVNVISEPIVQATTDGIITSDGTYRQADTIVCATGFDTSFTGRFPIIGASGIPLSEKWKDIPSTYLSITTDDFPNYFLYLGPASGLGSGNLLVLIERLADYFVECVTKMQRDNIAAMSVKKSAVDNFVAHSDKYFERTIFSSSCRSWYKGGTEDGRVNALWPGSSLHAMEVFRHPRWEDFDFQYVNGNPMGWFGDGWTENERHHCINVDYLDDENIDFPSIGDAHPQETLANGVVSNSVEAR